MPPAITTGPASNTAVMANKNAFLILLSLNYVKINVHWKSYLPVGRYQASIRSPGLIPTYNWAASSRKHDTDIGKSKPKGHIPLPPFQAVHIPQPPATPLHNITGNSDNNRRPGRSPSRAWDNDPASPLADSDDSKHSRPARRSAPWKPTPSSSGAPRQIPRGKKRCKALI